MKKRIILKAVLSTSMMAIVIFGVTRATLSDWQVGRITTSNLYTETYQDGSWDCPRSGGDCSEVQGVIIYEYEKQAGGGGGSNWVIAGTLDSVSATIPGKAENLNPAGFTFPSGATITIDSVNFPGVGPTQTFDLSGITTDSEGNFTASNPD